MKKLHILIALFAVALMSLTSCRRDIVYSRYYTIPSGEWHVDSTIRFDYRIDDAATDYRMIVYLRHTERYPYQNMWLFVGDAQRRDTIEFYLADDRGQWLGDTHNGFIEMPVLLDENRHYPDTGTYYLEVQHAMRDTLLRGITDLGLEIISNGQK